MHYKLSELFPRLTRKMCELVCFAAKNLQRPGVKVTHLQQAPNQQQQQQQLLQPPPTCTPPQQLSPGQPQPQTSPQGQQVASPQQQQRRHMGSDQYLHLELQKIELEKERLRREQDEVVRRVSSLLTFFRRGWGL